jgi:hypothetical protein
MTTGKKTATWLRLEAYMSTRRDNLVNPQFEQGILGDAHAMLHDAIESSDSEQAAEAMVEDYFAERQHFFKSRVKIPEAMASAAFGERPTLAAQAELVKRYGEEPAKECARQWRTAIGSLKPGRHPDSGSDSGPAKTARRESDDAAPNKNPWHPRWAGKDRHAAQASIIKSLGTKVAASLARSAGVTLTGTPLRK